MSPATGVRSEAIAAWSRHLGERVDPPELLARLAEGTLSEEFARTASEAGDRPGLTIGETTASHRDLDEGAARLGGVLAGRGLGPGDRVLIAGRSSVPLVLAYLGVLRCGATALPVDEAATAAELQAQIGAARPALAFADGGPAERLSGLLASGELPALVGLEPDRVGEAFPDLDSAGPIAPVTTEEPAILAFTSGTTGEPKVVPLSHANVLASIRAAIWSWRFDADDVLVHALPLSHQHGLGGLHAALLTGAHVVVDPRFDPARFCDLVRRWSASVIMAVPTIYERLSDWEGIAAAGMDSLRLAISGSAPLPPTVAERAATWLGQLPLERYGSTEAGLVLSNLYEGERRPGSVGIPLPGIEVRILDPAGAPVEAGESGELVVRGPQVFAGYLDRPEATEEAFTDDGWFRSGDLARLDPDHEAVAITGRIKEMIISGGLNVFPREVEAALEQHRDVQRAGVVGVPSERWGEEVVGVVVPAGAADPDPDRLIEHCRERLSAFKCPKRVLVLSELPTSEMGKLRRDELVAIAESTNTTTNEKET